MKLIISLLYFFLIETYSFIPFSNVRLAPKNARPFWRTPGPHKKLSHSHVIPRQSSSNNFNILFSKNPYQKMRLYYDTGFSGMWVFSAQYHTCESNWNDVQTKFRLYNHSASSTYVSPDQGEPKPYLWTYMDEFLFGHKATDVIKMLDTELSNVTFLEVTKASKYLTDYLSNVDGVMGLQYDPATNRSVLWDFCKKFNGNLAFGIYYPKDRTKGGDFTLCGADPQYIYATTAQWVKDVEPGTWKLPLLNVLLGDFYTIPSPTKIIIRIDFGPILGPETEIKEIYKGLEKKFPGKHLDSQFDCSLVPRLPEFKLNINHTVYNFTGEDYTRWDTNDPKTCTLLFEPGPPDYWTMGTSFIRKHYMMFDGVYRQVIINQVTND